MEFRDCFTELDSTVCFCGGRKGSGKSVCWKCWTTLSRSLQNRLYEAAGYPDAVADAHSFLSARGRNPLMFLGKTKKNRTL